MSGHTLKNSGARELTQGIKTLVTQARGPEVNPWEPCKKLQVLACICNSSIQLMSWDGRKRQANGSKTMGQLAWSTQESSKDSRALCQQGGQRENDSSKRTSGPLPSTWVPWCVCAWAHSQLHS